MADTSILPDTTLQCRRSQRWNLPWGPANRIALGCGSFYLIVSLIMPAFAGEVVCKQDRYWADTLRCDDGVTWRKDRFGYETWRDSEGAVCKRDRYGGTFRCKGGSFDLDRGRK